MKTPSAFFRLCAFALALLISPAIPTLHAQTTAQPTCQGTTVLTSLSGTFSDRTSTSATYGNNMDCFWLIQPSGTVTGSTISLSFQSFNTQPGVDVVRVYDGADTTARLLGTFSGRTIPAKVYSSGRTVLVRFTTDRSVFASGWELSYLTQPEVLAAPFQWFGTVDYYSRGLRQQYVNNDRRSWLIRPPGARRIALRFGEFDTEAGADEVRVYDGIDTTARLLGRFSGSSAATAPIFSSGGAMFVTFSSNQSTVRSGWNAYYVAERDSVFLDVQKEDRQVQEIVFPPTALGDSTVQQYQIIASNIRENLVLTASAGYRLSRSPQGTFTQTLTIEPDRNGLIPYMGIFVQAAATIKGDLNGSITHRVGRSVKTITLRTSVYTYSYWEPTSGPNLMSLNRSGFTNIGNTIFIGTARGIYRTTSNGSIWQPIAFVGQNVFKLTAIDTLLFAFLDAGTIHRSRDKGKSWENVGIWDSPDTSMWKGYSRNDPQSLFFKDSDIFQTRSDSSVNGFIYGLFRSKDVGKTWSLVLTTKFTPYTFITPDKILRVRSERALRSVDNGTTWQEDKEFTTSSIISGKSIFEVYTSPNNIYVIFDSLRRSTDNGKTWVSFKKNLPDAYFDFDNENFHVLLEGKVLLVSTFYGLFVSQDSGETFQKVNHAIGQTTGKFRTFTKDRDIYFEVNGKIYRSANLGSNWSPVMDGISGAPVLRLVEAGQTLYCYAITGSGDKVFFRSSNSGASWEQVNIPFNPILFYTPRIDPNGDYHLSHINMIAVRGDLFIWSSEQRVGAPDLFRLRAGQSDWESMRTPPGSYGQGLRRLLTDGKDLFCILGNSLERDSLLPRNLGYVLFKLDITSGEWRDECRRFLPETNRISVSKFYESWFNFASQITVNKNKLFLSFPTPDGIGFRSTTLPLPNYYDEDTLRTLEVWHPRSDRRLRSPMVQDSVSRNPRYQVPPDSVRSIVQHDTSLYVSTNFGVLRSLDNGETWQPTGFWNSTYYLCSSEYGLIAITTDGVYIFDEGVWRKNNEGLPKNTRPTMVTAIDNYMYAIFPPSSYQVVHRARIDAPSTVARAELTIPDTLTAFAGEEIDIPIKVSTAKLFFGDSATVTLTLRFNASVLQPIASFRPGAPQISTEDGQTLVRMSFKVRELRETVITLRCRVMLGNSVATPIFMTNISADRASVVATGPGIFTLKQFSEVGGTRSFRSAEAAVTLVALPNPVQDVVAVKYFVVEEGTTTITVVDMMGRTVKTLESGTMQQGWQTKTFPITDLPSGTYFLMLQTPSALKVQRMEVIR